MRSFEELEAKLKEVQAHYENLAVGVGGGAVGSVAFFTLEQPLNGVATVQATCLTPCPPGRSQLFKDVNGSWYAISPNTAVLQSIEITQNRRRTVQEDPKPVRIAMLVWVNYYDLSEGSSEGTIDRTEWYLIVESRPYLLITQTQYVSGDSLTTQTQYASESLEGRTLFNLYGAGTSALLSAAKNGTVYADFWNYDDEFTPGLNPAIADGLDQARHNYHFQVKNRKVSNLESSPSWRSEFVNTLLPRRSNLPLELPPGKNTCFDRYRGRRCKNIYDNNLWESDQALETIVLTPYREGIYSGIYDNYVLKYLQEKPITSNIRVAKIVADGYVCLTANNDTQQEIREVVVPKIVWDFQFDNAISGSLYPQVIIQDLIAY